MADPSARHASAISRRAIQGATVARTAISVSHSTKGRQLQRRGTSPQGTIGCSRDGWMMAKNTGSVEVSLQLLLNMFKGSDGYWTRVTSNPIPADAIGWGATISNGAVSIQYDTDETPPTSNPQMYRHDLRCDTCKHWGTDEECGAWFAAESASADVTAWGQGGGIGTKPDHGCTMWRAKPTETNRARE